jgi:ABC-type nickel/cobalt efflux system permease component RcnA
MRPLFGLIVALLWALACVPGPAVAQPAPAHPFGSAPQRGDPPVATTAASRDSLLQTLRQQQKRLQKGLVEALRRMRAEASVPAFLGLVMAGFVYGVLHAAGPGHGKAVISSYVFASGGNLWPALRLSFLSAFAQAVTAIVLIGALVLVLDFAAAHIRAATAWLESAGAILVTAIGAWMTWRAVNAFRRRRAAGIAIPGPGQPEHDPRHGHDDVCRHDRIPGLQADRSIILAVGLRPCSGALLVLVFGQAIGMFAAGMAATLAMALGTGLTVAALALLTVASRRIAERIAIRPAWAEQVHFALALAGSLAVTALGLLLLLAAFDSEGIVL